MTTFKTQYAYGHQGKMKSIYKTNTRCLYPLAFRKLAHFISSFYLTSHRIESCMSPFILLLLHLFIKGVQFVTEGVHLGIYTVQCRNDIKIYKNGATEHQAVSCLGCSIFDSSYKPESEKCKWQFVLEGTLISYFFIDRCRNWKEKSYQSNSLPLGIFLLKVWGS